VAARVPDMSCNFNFVEKLQNADILTNKARQKENKHRFGIHKTLEIF
jgi:hypothetical protein